MICVEFPVYLFWVLLLFLVPLNWLSAAFFAALIHEMFHITAIMLCGGKIRGIKIGIRGTVISLDPLNPLKELLCAAAGPTGSFLLLLLALRFPRLAICGFFQGCFNCLPVLPLDGGRVVRSLRVLWVQRKIPCKEMKIGVQ